MDERSTDDKSKSVMAQKPKAVGRDHLDEQDHRHANAFHENEPYYT